VTILPVTPERAHCVDHAREGGADGHRSLLARERCKGLGVSALHEEVSADYNDMIYAASAAEIAARRRAFIRKMAAQMQGRGR
jgi:hypothetical protein